MFEVNEDAGAAVQLGRHKWVAKEAAAIEYIERRMNQKRQGFHLPELPPD